MAAERGILAVLAALVLLATADVTPAVAHGPCGCLEPRLREAGGRPVAIVAGYPAYRVIFNPRPRDLGIAPGYLTSAYRADVPTATVLSRPRDRPLRRPRFRVPAATPAGVYLVLIFDGGEGGAHNTWDYLHVIDLDRSTAGVVARTAPDANAGASSSGRVGRDRRDRARRWRREHRLEIAPPPARAMTADQGRRPSAIQRSNSAVWAAVQR